MSSQNFKNITFTTEKRAGYNTQEVNTATANMIKELETLEASNKNYENQLSVLAAKIQEYRETEDAIKTTLINAQKMADITIKESKQKAEMIMRDAVIKSDTLIEKTKCVRSEKELELDEIKLKVSDFKNSMLKLYREHIQSISNIPEVKKTAEKAVVSENSQEKENVKEAIKVEVNKKNDEIKVKPKFDFANMELEEEFTKA